jgi:hypothetical protein
MLRISEGVSDTLSCFFWLNIQGVVALKKTRISGISIEKTEHITVGQLDRTKKRGNNPRN